MLLWGAACAFCERMVFMSSPYSKDFRREAVRGTPLRQTASFLLDFAIGRTMGAFSLGGMPCRAM
jgi:hypothetical protein